MKLLVPDAGLSTHHPRVLRDARSSCAMLFSRRTAVMRRSSSQKLVNLRPAFRVRLDTPQAHIPPIGAMVTLRVYSGSSAPSPPSSTNAATGKKPLSSAWTSVTGASRTPSPSPAPRLPRPTRRGLWVPPYGSAAWKPSVRLANANATLSQSSENSVSSEGKAK
jgi:hypothetical protein